MLTGACFCNDARLAHALGQHGLANGVVDFVSTCVVQVFAFQIDLRTTHFTAHARGMIDGRGPADEVRQLVFELGQKRRIVLVFGIGLAQFEDGVCQGFADEAAAKNAKVARGIGLLVSGHGVIQWHRLL